MRLLPAFVLASLLAACATQPIAPPPAALTCPPAPLNTPSAPTVTPPVTARYTSVEWQALPEWSAQSFSANWPAWLASCKRLESRAAWAQACQAAHGLNADDNAGLRQYFETYFQPWQITTSDEHDTGLITGYYEPLLKGSLTPKSGSAPIYGVPDDLLTIDLGELFPELKGQRVRGRLDGHKVVPYWNRGDIDTGRAPLAGKAIAWADDPLEAFFLEVQGSGRIRLEDGSLLRVGYADQNGYPYKSIGKWLVDHGELKVNEASMQGIQAWARANPTRLKEMLESNPSFVFFRVLPSGNGGPMGALNVPLTDGVSAAVDPKFVPLGAPLYVSTTWPNQDKPLNRMLQAQDTGGAIRGPIRLDLFWGFGAEAGALAGRMRQQGHIWVLWPKGLALPPATNG